MSAFRQQVVNTNLNSMEEVLLTPEQTAAFDEELADQESFLNFHTGVGTSDLDLEHACQCLVASDARDTLNEYNVRFTEISFQCDCESEFILPVSLVQCSQEENVSLTSLLTDEVFD